MAVANQPPSVPAHTVFTSPFKDEKNHIAVLHTVSVQSVANKQDALNRNWPSVPCEVHPSYIHVHQNINLTRNWKPSRGRSRLSPTAL